MTPDEALGRVIHMAMWERRVSQSALAPKLGMDQSTLSKKLRGLRPWEFSEFIAAADELHIDARDLLSGMWGPTDAPISMPPVDVAPVAQRIELPPSKRKSERLVRLVA